MEIAGIEAQARPLPLVVLADTSGSMSGAKMVSLNHGLATLLQDLKADTQTAESVLLSVIEFNGSVREIVPLETVKRVSLPTLKASGQTALGAALRLALAQLSDATRVPKRCLTPVVIIASDGRPTDEWRMPLEELKAHPRAGGALRLALAIGDDADMSVLAECVSPEYPVLRADEPEKIKTFFKWATWVSQAVFKSGGRNRTAQAPPPDLLP